MNHRILPAALVMLAGLVSSIHAANIEGLARNCNNCHGTDGVSVGRSMPSIAGLSESYLKNIMMEWKIGARDSANMTRLIKGYSDDEIADLARYYARMPWTPVPQKASADTMAMGKEATERCETCHGVTGGQPDDSDTPMLAGQWARYMELELMKYRDKGFRMTHRKMTNNARKLDVEGVSAAAQFHGAHSK